MLVETTEFNLFTVQRVSKPAQHKVDPLQAQNVQLHQTGHDLREGVEFVQRHRHKRGSGQLFGESVRAGIECG